MRWLQGPGQDHLHVLELFFLASYDVDGFRLMRQVLFGENTIRLRPDAAQKRGARYHERNTQADAATHLADAQDRLYESLDE